MPKKKFTPDDLQDAIDGIKNTLAGLNSRIAGDEETEGSGIQNTLSSMNEKLDSMLSFFSDQSDKTDTDEDEKDDWGGWF